MFFLLNNVSKANLDRFSKKKLIFSTKYCNLNSWKNSCSFSKRSKYKKIHNYCKVLIWLRKEVLYFSFCHPTVTLIKEILLTDFPDIEGGGFFLRYFGLYWFSFYTVELFHERVNKNFELRKFFGFEWRLVYS